MKDEIVTKTELENLVSEEQFFDNKIESSIKGQPQIRKAENEYFSRNFLAQEFVAECDEELDFKLEDSLPLNTKVSFFEHLLNRVERLVIVLCHKIFDEVEAATYLRLPDPENRGRETIRNYALRSKKISYYKVGRNGLTFLKADLDMALNRFKVQSFRDL